MLKVNLKKILKERGITLSEVSEGTGISLRGLSAFQNQKTDGVKYNTIDAICDYLNIEVSDLIKRYDNIYNLSCNIDIRDFDTKTNVKYGEKDNINGKLTISNEIEMYVLKFSFKISFEYSNSDFIDLAIYLYDLEKPKNLPKHLEDFINLKNINENGSAFYTIFSHLISQECLLLNDFPNVTVWDNLRVKYGNSIIPPFMQLDIIADETMYGSTSEKLIFPKKEYIINTVPANPKEKITDSFGYANLNIKFVPNFNSLITFDEISHIDIKNDLKRDIFIQL
ncbi:MULTISPECIES: helix-turn-helix domain-containing protein [Staphylococcaceae]|uniref:Putative transcriptional regulator n=1 Tax=Macrococcoides caseolyticum TaxID=69966 RepID=A0A1S7BGU9_9STAP|nr:MULTISPECIES: helix-turn-helix transcriptional regulator [Macrococcus]AQX82872.1 putative transcriptional regulator [Macrococcus caseolyticus]AQX82912.1 putative transcriptional regulator [Macrococcus caseolyticus]ARQ03561.1 putative transcriptional regulator [Macrococcus caseolyticus]MCO4095872.1 helix-turn-helix transcriptional regulator [Macrococcus canis]PKE11833.1 XRE family transcriptional regulator [Macrococcus caseolyticus]